VIVLIAALVVIFGLLVFMWVSVGREPGPGAADVAIAYERAWDDLDFGLLYELSGEELRDGMRRDRFVAAKRTAYANTGARGRLDADIEVEATVAGNQTALVVTRIASNGETMRNNVVLEKRSNGWVVVGYSIRPDE
jgi:hypothetical protein